MSYKIDQGVIQDYKDATTVNILQIPDGYVMTSVRLPVVLSHQFKPKKGSVVLVASEGLYKSFIVCILREPVDFVNSENNTRGMTDATKDFLLPGELYMESAGDPSAPTAGTGSSIYLSNNGTITVSSGQRKECLIIGGRIDDTDHEVVLQGDNGFFQSTIDEVTNIRSTFTFDADNTLRVANDLVVSTNPTLVETPMAELTFDNVGNVTLRNTVTPTGVDKGSLKIDTLGVINLNGGTVGAARLNDTVLSNSSSDPTFWTSQSSLQTFMMGLSGLTGPLAPVAAVAQAYLASVPLAPTSLTGKISTASTVVKVK